MKFSRGQAAIALSLAVPMMVGFACIGADMWSLYLSSARLQRAADAAVLSGAIYLPANPALARSAARIKAQMNGIRESEIVYDRSAPDDRSLTMVVERNVPYRFARLFGLSQSLLIVKAVAGINSSRSNCSGCQPNLPMIAPRRSAALAGAWRPLPMGGCDGCGARQNHQRNLLSESENSARTRSHARFDKLPRRVLDADALTSITL